MAKRKRKPQKHKRQIAEATPTTIERGTAERPTAERLKRGTFAFPTGTFKDQRAIVALDTDVIGRLFVAELINSRQEQAARHFEQVRAAYLVDYGVAGFKSCLAGGVASHDSSDGDPAARHAYFALEAKLSKLERVSLILVCEGRQPSLEYLRSGCDAISGLH